MRLRKADFAGQPQHSPSIQSPIPLKIIEARENEKLVSNDNLIISSSREVSSSRPGRFSKRIAEAELFLNVPRSPYALVLHVVMLLLQCRMLKDLIVEGQ